MPPEMRASDPAAPVQEQGALIPAPPTLADLQASWQAKQDGFDQKKAETQTRRRGLVTKIKAIENRKPDHFGGKLKKAFECVTRVPWMKCRLKLLTVESHRRLSAQQTVAQGIYRDLGNIIMEKPEVDPAVVNSFQTLQTGLDKVKEALQTVRNAASSCSSAAASRRIARSGKGMAKIARAAVAIAKSADAGRDVNRANDAVEKLCDDVNGMRHAHTTIADKFGWVESIDRLREELPEQMGQVRGSMMFASHNTAAGQLQDMGTTIGRFETLAEKQVYQAIHVAAETPGLDSAIKDFAAEIKKNLPMDLKRDSLKTPTVRAPKQAHSAGLAV